MRSGGQTSAWVMGCHGGNLTMFMFWNESEAIYEVIM